MRGKASRLERLPLPADVGEALAGYLTTGRPGGEERALFLRVLAPHRRITAGAVGVVVHAACKRAGLDPIVAHRLRHTVATELLRRGAGLCEIGQLLATAAPRSPRLRQGRHRRPPPARPPLAGRCGMSAFRSAAADYLAIRRAVGFKLQRAEGLLFSFVGFLEAERATRVTTQLALRWATLPARANPGWRNSGLCVARGFARHMSALDPATEVPPADLLARPAPGSSRAEPYLYSTAEVTALVAAARSIRSRFVAATCETLIGLLAVSGMRVGEALRLDVGDLDWARGVLVIRDSKFNRSREVPLHNSTLDALQAYGRLRESATRSRARTVSSSPAAAGASATGRSASTSGTWRAAPGCSPGRPDAGPAFTISGTALPAPPSKTVPLGRRRTGQAAAAVHLPRPHRPDLDLLVLGQTGATRPGGQPGGGLPGGAPMAPSPRSWKRSSPIGSSPSGGQALHGRLLQRYVPAPAHLCPAAHRQSALPASACRPRRPADRRIPRPPRARKAEQHPDPQRQARRDPLPVPLRRPAPGRRGGHPARALHPPKAL